MLNSVHIIIYTSGANYQCYRKRLSFRFVAIIYMYRIKWNGRLTHTTYHLDLYHTDYEILQIKCSLLYLERPFIFVI